MIRFLMIDDNPIEHMIMQKMLGKFKLFPDANYNLDAKAAMDYFNLSCSEMDELPDVVFLDLNMPGFDGWDFMDGLQQLYKKMRKPVDVYVLSSSIDPKDKMRALKYEFVKACISKPIQMETLLNLHSIYYQDKRFAS